MSEPETEEEEPDVDPLDPFEPDPEEEDGSLPGLDPAITLPPEDSGTRTRDSARK